jgi:hypothetical protein
LRFIDNKDDTITDTDTGLIWQIEPPEKAMTWKEAIDYCENLRLDGYTNWRLPTITELKSLVDYSRYNPATKMPNTSSSFYWSSTTGASNTPIAWGVDFYNGFDGYSNKSNSYYVRAVRGGQSVIKEDD